MKNKKGFTLVELLAVIVIIAIVSSIATVGIISIRSLINESLLDSKIDIIESGAVYWGQDSMVLLVKDKDDLSSACLMDENSTYEQIEENYDTNTIYIEYSDSSYGYAIVKIVDDLKDYITASDTCYDDAGISSACVKNDVTGEDMGNDLVYIYVSNNRVYAKYIGNN